MTTNALFHCNTSRTILPFWPGGDTSDWLSRFCAVVPLSHCQKANVVNSCLQHSLAAPASPNVNSTTSQVCWWLLKDEADVSLWQWKKKKKKKCELQQEQSGKRVHSVTSVALSMVCRHFSNATLSCSASADCNALSSLSNRVIVCYYLASCAVHLANQWCGVPGPKKSLGTTGQKALHT